MTTPRTLRLQPRRQRGGRHRRRAQGATAAGLTARESILRGHKMAVVPIREGEPVRKFGQIIGFAKSPHRAGRVGA